MRERPWEGDIIRYQQPSWNADFSGRPDWRWEWDGGLYTGDLKWGVRHGRGLNVFGNGDTYDGTWVKDKRHGDGEFTEASTGVVTNGMFREDRLIGLRTVDGGAFVGTWENGQPVEGEYTHENGCVFRGTFQDGKQWVGQIERDFPGDGSSYTGAILRGERIGQGRCTYADGAIYDGTFQKGKREGEGVCVWPAGGRYIGLWREDRPWGGHMEECPYFGAGSVYTGVVGGGRQHGKGRCEYASGDVYDGDWCAGERHGKGVYRDHKGGHFRGNFKKNHPWEGTMERFVYENGDCYEGTWKAGMQDQGAFKRNDGHGFVGKFINNLPFEGVYTRPHSDASGPSSCNPTPTPSGASTPQRRGSIQGSQRSGTPNAYLDPILTLTSFDDIVMHADAVKRKAQAKTRKTREANAQRK